MYLIPLNRELMQCKIQKICQETHLSFLIELYTVGAQYLAQEPNQIIPTKSEIRIFHSESEYWILGNHVTCVISSQVHLMMFCLVISITNLGQEFNSISPSPAIVLCYQITCMTFQKDYINNLFEGQTMQLKLRGTNKPHGLEHSPTRYKIQSHQGK